VKSKNILFPQKEKVEIQEQEVNAPESGELLCAAEKSLISTGTETRCLLGIFDPETNWNEWVQYPFHPGYSMAGMVLETGPGVQGFKPGDRVWANGVPHHQFFNANLEQCLKLPEGISEEDGAWSNLACTTQLGIRRAELRLGETVGVVGLGILGQLVVQYLRAHGARRIICVDTFPKRLEMAKAHGATDTLNMDAQSARKPIEEITGGRMLDVVFDITGHPAVLAPASQLLRKMGRLVLLGDATTPSKQFLGPRILSNSLSILGIHASMAPESSSPFNPWTFHEMAGLFYDYLLQGRMKVSDLVTDRENPFDAPKVYDRLLKDRSQAMGVIFDWKRTK
jgi:2-desacetyl-2-hydroxyethyl bacteriochlorophyllide A dehydrogenase